MYRTGKRVEASCGSRERRELTEETRPTSLRPGGVVAPEVAGLLSKASPRPSTAPLPSFPSPNPPHFLTVIGLLGAGEQFVSTTLSSSRLCGSCVRLWVGGSRASQTALGSGSRRCSRSGDRSSRCCSLSCVTCGAQLVVAEVAFGAMFMDLHASLIHMHKLR